MQKISFSRPCSVLTLVLLILGLNAAAAYPEPCDDTTRQAAIKLIVSFDCTGPVEIEDANLAQVLEKVLDVLETHDSVLEYEASISAPDKRLACTPFLSKRMTEDWRFLVLYQDGSSSNIIAYNLSHDEFRNIVEELYDVSMYHFDPGEL